MLSTVLRLLPSDNPCLTLQLSEVRLQKCQNGVSAVRGRGRHSHASLELGEQLRCQGVPSAGVSHDVCEFGESEPLCNPPLPNGPRVSLCTPTIRGKLGEARKISVITPITNTGSRGICDGTQMISNPNSLVRLEKQATKFRVVANAGEIEREGQGVPDGT